MVKCSVSTKAQQQNKSCLSKGEQSSTGNGSALFQHPKVLLYDSLIEDCQKLQRASLSAIGTIRTMVGWLILLKQWSNLESVAEISPVWSLAQIFPYHSVNGPEQHTQMRNVQPSKSKDALQDLLSFFCCYRRGQMQQLILHLGRTLDISLRQKSLKF